MQDTRPDPDRILHQIQQQEADAAHVRGRLKIFFGYAAGVGKTYAMLEAAHAALAAGTDVVAGYIEPHTRPDTLALLEGLEQLPPLCVEYKNVTLREFDLDAAIARRPALLLVDELAHTNAEGCRHRKRCQDIEELLALGIDVYTTVNVQHLESLNDIVAAVTGITVRERVPDSVFDNADQVELVDIEPDDLLARLDRGKVYRPLQARRAMDHFFTRENLVALREIALRRTADRVNRRAEKGKDASAGYYTGEHILICLSSSPSNARVIRTAARLSDAFHGRFTALFVEVPGTRELNGESLARLRGNLRLAEQLGARIATIYGEDVAAQIAEYARASGVSKIVIGRSNNRRGILPRPTLVEQLTALAPNVDVYIIPDNLPPYRRHRRAPPERLTPADTFKTLGLLGLSTAVALGFAAIGLSEANVITVFILGVLFVSVCTGSRIYGAAASFFSVLLFNFFFTVPRFTLQFNDPGYAVTFAIMFAASFITSTLTVRAQRQARQSSLKAYRTEDGSIQLFRPLDNVRRMNASAERMALPQIPEDLALAGITELVKVEQDWVPHEKDTSLYIRPFMVGLDAALGVHSSHHCQYIVIVCPVGAYYPEGLDPVKIYVEDQDVRAVKGGTGYTKCGGNYAASIRAGERAEQNGYAQVLWLDGVHRKYIEEVGSMNVMFQVGDTVLTPELTGSVLPGITRKSCLELLKSWGLKVEERLITAQELFDAGADGTLKEAWGTGTAAVISPIGEMGWEDQHVVVNGGKIGPLAQRLYDTLTGIQWGTMPDELGWTVKVD